MAEILSGIKILVAEDVPDSQTLMNFVLTRAGAEVEIVGNGAAAVERALANDHDIVLMDIQMPVLDGNAATEELRSRGFRKPIIALSAHAMRGDRERSLRAGCNDHLTKPLDTKRLLVTVARFIER